MINPSAPRALLFAAALAASAASATPPRPSADPLQPLAPVPAATAPAPFAQYQRHSAVEILPGTWRAANDTVNRIGGWRTYAREAQAAVPAPAAPATMPAGRVPAPAVPATPAHRH